MTTFKEGQAVRVRPGVKDPDFGTDLSGWQGRVVGTTLEPEELILVAWDSQTLLQMDDDLISTCLMDGYDLATMTLGAADVEASKPRDKQKDVDNALAEIYGRYGLEHQSDFESMIISMMEQADLLDDDEAWDDWDEESVELFDIDQFFADLQIEDAKEQKRILSCFAQGLEIYYEYIYGYRKYGRKPEFLIPERMGESYIFGFGMVEAVRAKRGVQETSKLAICQYALQNMVPEAEYGVPHGIIVLLSYLAQTGHLVPNVFRAAMQINHLMRHWIWPWQTEEAIALSDWLIGQESIPPEEKLFWLWYLSMQFNDFYHMGKKVVNHWLAHPDLPDSIKKELAQGWLNEAKLLGTPPAAWRLVQAQATGNVAEAERALKELGASRKEIKEVKKLIAQESKQDFFSRLFSSSLISSFDLEWRFLLTPNWLKRIAVLALARLGEDAWETAVRYLDATRDYGAEAINAGVADIIAEFGNAMPPEEVRELIEIGIQITHAPTRKTFYRLSTQFYGTELLAQATEDRAASVRKWGAKELKKLGRRQ